ncbi:MAG: glycoside hydrolase family 5 protein [Verrucomicrobiota bacterium]
MSTSKTNVVICFISILLWANTPARAQEQSVPDAFVQNQKLGRSVNILGYDPLWRSREQARFKAEYFQKLKAAGFNSVRINLHPFRFMDATNAWTLKPSWFAVLDWAVNEAQGQGLAVILDLHEFNTLGNEPTGTNQIKFLAFWGQMAAHYQNAPGSVYFEVLNEPFGKLTPELWNEYFSQALVLIRYTNPTRTVIVGPGQWNQIDRLAELKLPDNDRNLIVTVHFYEPFNFTHQGASWTDRKDKLGFDWTGSPEEITALNRAFDKADAWSKANKRPLFLGEFGAYDRAPMESRARWTAAVARAAEARDWSWAYWQFDGDFVLYDIKHEAWVEPLLNALIPKSPATK